MIGFNDAAHLNVVICRVDFEYLMRCFNILVLWHRWSPFSTLLYTVCPPVSTPCTLDFNHSNALVPSVYMYVCIYVFSLRCRKAERRMNVLKRQTDECTLKKETTLHHMEAVLSVAEHISKERDQLLHMVLMLMTLNTLYFMSRMYIWRSLTRSHDTAKSWISHMTSILTPSHIVLKCLQPFRFHQLHILSLLYQNDRSRPEIKCWIDALSPAGITNLYLRGHLSAVQVFDKCKTFLCFLLLVFSSSAGEERIHQQGC